MVGVQVKVKAQIVARVERVEAEVGILFLGAKVQTRIKVKIVAKVGGEIHARQEMASKVYTNTVGFKIVMVVIKDMLSILRDHSSL